MNKLTSVIVKRTKYFFPDLKGKMIMAGIHSSPEEFIHKTLTAALNMWGLIMFIFVLMATKIPIFIPITIIGAPLVFLGLFFYLMQYPTVRILKREREINKEIVFAGRFMVIEMESGVPLYDAINNLIPNYTSIGPYFREIITKVDLGTPLEDALNEAILYSPSKNMRRLLWQIVNSLKTGSEVHRSLNSVVEQIVREQMIEVKKYAKKLNPLAMFYMMMAIIIPTLGTAMLAVMTNFVAIEINLSMLILLALANGFMQFMFLNIIKAQRPAVDL
ncbi:type II secretion system F family protein [Candidatus Woesearchaeota archaeon]|nr:type II secretion system F family protein [Candidatus Woesearchaeota archaeon]